MAVGLLPALAGASHRAQAHVPWPKGAPVEAALTRIEPGNEEDGRLVLADLRTGTMKEIDSRAVGMRWSPDGSLLAYCAGKKLQELRIYRVRDGAIAVRRAAACAAYEWAFSPDGQSILSVEEDHIDVLSLPALETMEVIVGPAGMCLDGAPTWLHDGRTFAVCGLRREPLHGDIEKAIEEARRGKIARQLVMVQLDAGQPRATVLAPEFEDCKILGVRRARWLVLAGYPSDVDTVGPEGSRERLISSPPEDPYSYPYEPDAYFESLDSLVLGRSATGDRAPTLKVLVPLAGGHRRPWLKQFPRLRDVAVSDDEQWVLFEVLAQVPRGDTGNNALYLARSNGTGAFRVLKPRTDETWYVDAVPRPLPNLLR